MKIRTLRIYPILLPFRGVFSHAMRNRSAVSNVVIEVAADGGCVKGYGEAAPRSYVTGETREGVVRDIRQLVEHRLFPWRLEDASQIWDYVDALPNRRETNSAVCALEMCLLDALGRRQEKPVLDYFPADHRQETVSYGAVFPLAERDTIWSLSRFANAMKIHRIKIKAGKDIHQNTQALAAIQEVYGHRADIVMDVNMAWDADIACRHAPLIEEGGVRVVEQPMVPGHPAMKAFCGLMKSREVWTMADESACTLEEAESVFKGGDYTMMHVRLSKCGGLRRSLQIVRHLRERGVPFAIGCQLGESGILSAAGRVISLLCDDAAYYHCCYDEFLLQENVTAENVSFGLGGAAGPLDGHGLGVQVDTDRLRRLSAGREIVVLRGP